MVSAVEEFGWNESTYKAHECGRNGFENNTGRVYAKSFGVDFAWLMTGVREDLPAEYRAEIVDLINEHLDEFKSEFGRRIAKPGNDSRSELGTGATEALALLAVAIAAGIGVAFHIIWTIATWPGVSQ